MRKTNQFSLVFLRCATFALLGMIMLIVLTACGDDLQSSKNSLNEIAKAEKYEEVISYLNHSDMNTVHFALWRLETIEDHRVFDLYVSLWEGDEKILQPLNSRIHDDIISRMVVCASLLQAGYYYSDECEKFIYQQIDNPDNKVREKLAEMLSSVHTEKSVELLEKLALEDRPEIGYRAISSLSSIAQGQRRITDSTASTKAGHALNNLSDGLNPQLIPHFKNLVKQVNRNGIFSGRGYTDSYQSSIVYPRTYTLLKPYADNGDAQAQYFLSQFYFSGNGVEQNQSRGLEYLHLSANNQYLPALVELSRRYRVGDEVDMDVDLSMKFLEQAAEQGDSNAQLELGRAYNEGRYGVEQDINRGTYWMQKGRKSMGSRIR